MKNSHKTLLFSIFLLTCLQLALAIPPAPPAVGPQGGPEPLLLSPNFDEDYTDIPEDTFSSPEQHMSTRFQARIITLKQNFEQNAGTRDERQEQGQQQQGIAGLGIQYGWTKHQWVRNLNKETVTDEVYRREIVVGVLYC